VSGRKPHRLRPEPLGSITDAATVGVALANDHDSVATLDQKLIRRMTTLGVPASSSFR